MLRTPRMILGTIPGTVLIVGLFAGTALVGCAENPESASAKPVPAQPPSTMTPASRTVHETAVDAVRETAADSVRKVPADGPVDPVDEVADDFIASIEQQAMDAADTIHEDNADAMLAEMEATLAEELEELDGSAP